MVKCIECGKDIASLRWTHFKHNCTGNIKSLKEYKEKYPNSITMDDNIKKKYGVTLDKCIAKHGVELGNKKWKEYCNKQANSNTFEYKHNKHGWTLEQFNEYNKSRSQTLENMINRHGIELGNKKWKEYCNKQAYAGTALSYFIDIYGEDLGTEKYEIVNKAKACTLDNYIKLYGDELGTQKFNDRINRASSHYSKISQKLFDTVEQYLQTIGIVDSYYATKNTEYGKMDVSTKTYRKYDFVVPSISLCVEYNGNIFHANPNLYDANDIPRFRGNKLTAKELWEKDEHKIELLKSFGFEVIVIWETDYISDPDGVVNQLKDIINDKCKLL